MKKKPFTLALISLVVLSSCSKPIKYEVTEEEWNKSLKNYNVFINNNVYFASRSVVTVSGITQNNDREGRVDDSKYYILAREYNQDGFYVDFKLDTYNLETNSYACDLYQKQKSDWVKRSDNFSLDLFYLYTGFICFDFNNYEYEAYGDGYGRYVSLQGETRKILDDTVVISTSAATFHDGKLFALSYEADITSDETTRHEKVTMNFTDYGYQTVTIPATE